MLYVIVRSDGKFVAPPGREASYTDKLQDAWGFRTRAEAEPHCCGNESIQDVADLIYTGNA